MLQALEGLWMAEAWAMVGESAAMHGYWSGRHLLCRGGAGVGQQVALEWGRVVQVATAGAGGPVPLHPQLVGAPGGTHSNITIMLVL